MNDAALVLCIREGRGNGLLDARQAVRADDQDILHAAIFQRVQYG